MDHQLEPVLWLALSFVLYALATNVTWYYRQPRPGRVGRLVEAIRNWPYRDGPLQALRLLYYLGLPYLALLKGVINPRSMGLSDLDWLRGAGLGVALGGGAFLLLALTWWYYAHSTHLLYPQADPLSSHLTTLNRPWGWALLLLDVIYLEVHWAFYRSGPIQVLADLYSGVFLGLALAFLEAYSSPHLRRGLRQPEQAGGILLTGSLALVVALIYLFTHNLWLCVLSHLGIEVGLLRLWGVLYGSREGNNGNIRSPKSGLQSS
ncbi:MAG: hypothetical protein ACE5MB_09420 [Anaerolineae bacterium]